MSSWRYGTDSLSNSKRFMLECWDMSDAGMLGFDCDGVVGGGCMYSLHHVGGREYRKIRIAESMSCTESSMNLFDET